MGRAVIEDSFAGTSTVGVTVVTDGADVVLAIFDGNGVVGVGIYVFGPCKGTGLIDASFEILLLLAESDSCDICF